MNDLKENIAYHITSNCTTDYPSALCAADDIIKEICEVLLSEEIAILTDDAWVKYSGRRSDGFGAMQAALTAVVEKLRGE